MRASVLVVTLSLLTVSCALFNTANAKKIKVMIVDTGVAPVEQIKPYLATSNTKIDLDDKHGHGTHIAGIVLYGPKLNDPVCPEVELYSCNYYHPDVKVETSECFNKARSLEIDIANFSGGGRGYLMQEDFALRLFKGKLVVAAGNYEIEHGKVSKPAWDISKENYYPASLNYKNMVVVGNGTSFETKAESSNWGKEGMIWRDGSDIRSFSRYFGTRTMSGTSQATAIYTHELLQEACQRLRSAK